MVKDPLGISTQAAAGAWLHADAMNGNFFAPGYDPVLRRRQVGKALGTVGRVLCITAGVLLIVGGVALVGLIVLFFLALNSMGSNK
jgi:hypothetical protein